MTRPTGRFTWNLIGGALGSTGAIWPSTLQNSGLAGITRAAGVGPLSTTASGVGVIMEAESIRTALSVGRIRSPHVAAGSPAIFAAIASALKSEVAASSEANGAHARRSNLRRFIFSSPLLSCNRFWAGRQAYNGLRRADVNRNKNAWRRRLRLTSVMRRHPHPDPPPQAREREAGNTFHFTSEQPPSASGRNAWSAGTVETSL